MKSKILLLCLTMGLLLFPFQTTLAHCDTENGPVITAAREALQTNNVKLVLIWVKKQDEAIIKEAFQKTVNLRKISQEVQRVVDNYFFETLVRIHRAGEGVAYTGIKDSGKVDIPIAAADDAIEKNSLADVIKLLNEAINKGVNEKFNDATSKSAMIRTMLMQAESMLKVMCCSCIMWKRFTLRRVKQKQGITKMTLQILNMKTNQVQHQK